MIKYEEIYYHDISKIAKSLEQIAKALNQPKNITSNKSPNVFLEELKDTIKWCCYDGKSIGRYEIHFKELERQLNILNILKSKLKVKSYTLGIEDIIIYEEDEQDYEIIKKWLNGDSNDI